MKLRDILKRGEGDDGVDPVALAEARARRRKVLVREAIAQRIADDLHGVAVGDDIVQVRLGPDLQIGPLGGESQRLTVQWGRGADSVIVHINVYANGVMAPNRDRILAERAGYDGQ